MLPEMCLVPVYLGEHLLLADLAADVEDPELVDWVLREGAPDDVFDQVSLKVTDPIELFQTNFAGL